MVFRIATIKTCWQHQQTLDWVVISLTLITFSLVSIFIILPMSVWNNWLSLNKKRQPKNRKNYFWGKLNHLFGIKQIFEYHQTTSKCIALFYSFLFNFYFFWIIIYCLYCQSICILPTFYWIVLAYFISCPFFYNFIKTRHHVPSCGTHHFTLKSAVEFLTTPQTLVCSHKVSIFSGFDEEGNRRVEKNSISQLPVSQWMDQSGNKGRNILAESPEECIHQLLENDSYPFFVVHLILNFLPADNKSNEFMKDFSDKEIEKINHRGKIYKAEFSNQLFYQGEVIQRMIIHKEEIYETSSNFWISQNFFKTAIAGLAFGCPFPCIVVLCISLNERKLTINKPLFFETKNVDLYPGQV